MPRRAFRFLDWWGRFKDTWDLLPGSVQALIVGGLLGALGGVAAAVRILEFVDPWIQAFFVVSAAFGFAGILIVVRDVWRVMAAEETDLAVENKPYGGHTAALEIENTGRAPATVIAYMRRVEGYKGSERLWQLPFPIVPYRIGWKQNLGRGSVRKLAPHEMDLILLFAIAGQRLRFPQEGGLTADQDIGDADRIRMDLELIADPSLGSDCISRYMAIISEGKLAFLIYEKELDRQSLKT